MIVPVVQDAHHWAHLRPLLSRLPNVAERITSSDDIALTVSYGGVRLAERAGFRRIVLAQHGAGQSYAGDTRTARHPAYPGGDGNDAVGLFLVPNEQAARRWRERYPAASVEVVGSPRIETLPKRDGDDSPLVVAVSFHWSYERIPELHSAFPHYRVTLRDLASRYKVIGHAHPKRRDLRGIYERMGIEFVADFDDVCRRADLYVCDNSSTIFEFASTGRPVVLLNIPAYRREVWHGLRFWEARHVGMECDDPKDLAAIVEWSLTDPMPSYRHDALRRVYAHRGHATERAVAAIEAWAA